MSHNLYYKKYSTKNKIGSLIDQITAIKSELNKLNLNQSDLNSFQNLLFLLVFDAIKLYQSSLKIRPQK